MSANDQKILNFRVKGEDPVRAVAALYSNFLAVSQVGTDVQFEFIFLDLNLVANAMEQLKKAESPGVPDLQGKTVAKVVMPAATFFQLHEHFETIFRAINEALSKTAEAQHDRSSNVG